MSDIPVTSLEESERPMTGASKILTVSYGTFSCTLEGFDDPFNTMKAIAEYFRDLTSDDRYFGAEPPQPDAATLHRIAEREAQRRVEAKYQDNGVILRAGNDLPLPQATAHEATPKATATAKAEEPPQESVAPQGPSVSDVASLAETAPPPMPKRSGETMADRMQRLRQMAQPMPEPPAAAARLAAVPNDSPLAADTDLGAELQPLLPQHSPVVDDLASGSQDEDETHSAAAGLRPGRPTRAMRAAAAQAARMAPAVELTASAEVAPVARPAPTVAADIAMADQPAPPRPQAEEQSAKLERARARVIRVRRLTADPLAEAAVASPVAPPVAPNLVSAVASPAVFPAASAIATAAPQVSPQHVTAPASLLSAQDEADLEAELAAVTAEAQPAASQTPDPFSPDTEAAMSRLMAKANTAMVEDDARRRQSALSHLKAAVAATRADHRAGGGIAELGTSKLGAYRDDLASMVRSPVASGDFASTNRPAPLVLVSEQRVDRMTPPPLAPLVALQPAIEAELDDDDIYELPSPAPQGFARFAEQLGATDLMGLLQAAAAYIALVDGRDSFTRPQLMRYVAGLTEGSTREDGLRVFGTLLRDGVIERARRGQFAINPASAMLVEAKKLAG